MKADDIPVVPVSMANCQVDDYSYCDGQDRSERRNPVSKP